MRRELIASLIGIIGIVVGSILTIIGQPYVEQKIQEQRASELRFDEKSEAYTLTQVNNKSIKVDLPAIRPGGIVTFDIITDINNKVNFQELIEDGKILDKKSYDSQANQVDYLKIIAVGLIILIWGTFLVIAVMLLQRVWSGWNTMELNKEKP